MDDSNPCSWRAGLTALAGNKDTVGELFMVSFWLSVLVTWV